MGETWEQTKERLRKNGIVPQPFTVRFDTPDLVIEEPKIKPAKKREPTIGKAVTLYDVWKISLPPGINQIVLIGLTEKEATWWIEDKLKARVYEDDGRDTKTLIFYEKFPQGASPKERSVYSNPARFCTEDFPAFNNPRRIN